MPCRKIIDNGTLVAPLSTKVVDAPTLFHTFVKSAVEK